MVDFLWASHSHSNPIRGIIFDWGRTLFDRERNELFSGVPALLRRLSPTHRLAVVSLCPVEDIIRRLEVMRAAAILELFDVVVFCEANKDSMYEAVLRRWHGLSPQNVCIVDDRARRGVAWGNKMGCWTVWVRRGKFSAEVPDVSTGRPSATIESIEDILMALPSEQRQAA